jgi:ribosomal protein S18 acetylase RimI-like enzyme
MDMLQPVNKPDHPSLSFIQQLYETSFPLRERRDWNQVLSLLSNARMQLAVIEEAGRSIGFAIGWSISGWHFIEHLAIDPAQRGKQYGSRVMQQLIEHGQHHIILEVEPSHDDLARRRILFYERCGFHLVPFPYLQPPYRAGEEPVPMQLMSMPAITRVDELQNIAQAIKTTVYEPFY